MLAEIVVARIKSLSLASLPLDISLSNTTTMASSDAEMDDSDTSSALTDFLKTETFGGKILWCLRSSNNPLTTRQRVTGCG